MGEHGGAIHYIYIFIMFIYSTCTVDVDTQRKRAYIVTLNVYICIYIICNTVIGYESWYSIHLTARSLSLGLLLGIPWGLQVLLRHMAVLNSPAIFDGGRGSRRFRRVVSQNESKRAIVDDRNTTWYLNWLLYSWDIREEIANLI